MFRIKRERRHGGARRIAPRRFLLMISALMLLVPVQGIGAAAQVASGTIELSNTLVYGNTAYTIDYSYPTTADVGTNLTVRVTLHVKSLTGLVEYVNQYRILVSVIVGTQNVLTADVASNVNSSHLYPGSTWGPNNVVIPLTADNTGIAKGSSVNATVMITLQDQIWYGGNISVWITEPAMQGHAGTLVIQNGVTTTSTSTTNQGPGQTYLPYLLLGSGAVLVLLAVFFTRGARSPHSNQK